MWKAHHERVCNGEKLSWEFDIIGLCGTRRHMDTHAVPLLMPDGSTAHLAITRDITKRKEDELTLRESQHHYAQLLQALPVALYTTDIDGRITFYNEAAAEFAGRRPEPGEMWCVTWRLYHLDGTPLPHDQCPMAIALREGRPVRGIEAIAERPDGTRVRFLPFPTPLFDTTGQPTGAINLLVDTTAKYQAEEMASRLASIVESSDDAIVGKTLEGKVTSWNAGAVRTFGYEADEMIGQSITRIIPPELHDEEKRILARIRGGERVDHYESVRVTKDGRRLDISLTVSPVRDRLGKVIGASKVARDITDRKQAEKLQRLLLDELNHRIKNTLSVIQAIASQSLGHAKSPKDFVSGFNGRMEALARVHDLLTKKKLQGASLHDLVKEQVSLGGGEDNRIVCSGPELTLNAQLTVQLALVLHELATNARKYGALSVPGGRLSVQWELRTNDQRHLVLRWEESNGPRVNAPQNRGFGSTLIERTLKGCGGEASIHYSAAGVECKITLPLPDKALSNVEMSLSNQIVRSLSHDLNGDSPLKGKRVIIIEDEPLVSMDLEANLTGAGCEVIGFAGTLNRAKALVGSADCDVALLDANLAGHSVEELAAMLTQRSIPFAFVTGYERETLPSGFRDAVVLKKPASLNELIATVEMLVYRPTSVVQMRRRGEQSSAREI
jgi:PAS domain S-box-containing protein